MKRMVTILLSLTLALLLAVPAWAAMDTSLPRVVDELDWLEDSEAAELNDYILARSEEEGVDVGIFLMTLMPDGIDYPSDYADALYARGGYGWGDTGRCVMLTVDMYQGLLAVTSYEGDGELLTPGQSDAVSDLILDYINSDAPIAGSLTEFVDQVYDYVAGRRVAEEYDTVALPDWYPDDVASFVDFHTPASTPRVVDDADLFTDGQEAAMAVKIAAMREAYNMDFVVYTSPSAYGMEHNMLAADFYQFNGYGVGDDFSGGVLLICMDPMDRGWFTATCGRYRDLYTSQANERLNARLRPWLVRGAEGEEDAYGEGVLQYLDDTAAVMSGKKVYNYTIPAGLAAIAFLLIGGITLGIERGKMKTVRQAADAEEYLVPGSFDLRRHRDFYLHRTVTRTRRESSSKSGGGGGGFSSSGGRSFGGGGGKF